MQYLSRSEVKVLRLASMSILLRPWLVLRLPKRGKEKTFTFYTGTDFNLTGAVETDWEEFERMIFRLQN